MKTATKKAAAKPQSAPDPKARLLVRRWHSTDGNHVQLLICGDSTGAVAQALAVIAYHLGRNGERMESGLAACDPVAACGEFRSFVKVIVSNDNVDDVAARLRARFEGDSFRPYFSSVKEN